MNGRIKARLYFDVVSPFSHLYLKRFDELHSTLDVELVPVLFAGLLRHWDNKGPAELPTKRLHTYRYCAWMASRHGIEFRMPPRHPFNPLPIQRLLVAVGARRGAVESAFDFIYGQGRDPADEWSALCETLGVGVADAKALIADPAVKQRLIDNTEGAAAEGVFGVPSLAVRGQLFWGGDTIAWANAFVDDPHMFESGEMNRAVEIEIGAQRKEQR